MNPVDERRRNWLCELHQRTKHFCAKNPELASMRRSLMEIEADYNRAGWNQPPTFGFLQGAGSGVTLVPWELTNGHLRSGRDPVEVLAQWAHAIGEASLRMPIVHWDFRGYAFIGETWSVYGDTHQSPADFKYDEAMYAEGRLGEHPRRIESRMLSAVTLDGTRWMLGRDRGIKPICWCDRAIPEGLGEFGGELFPSLDAMVLAARATIQHTKQDEEITS